MICEGFAVPKQPLKKQINEELHALDVVALFMLSLVGVPLLIAIVAMIGDLR